MSDMIQAHFVEYPGLGHWDKPHFTQVWKHSRLTWLVQIGSTWWLWKIRKEHSVFSHSTAWHARYLTILLRLLWNFVN